DGLHGFGNAVALQRRLPEIDHDADQQAADGGNQDGPRAKMVVGRVGDGEGELPEVEDVGEEVDEFEEALGDESADEADQHGAGADFDDFRFESYAELSFFVGLGF